MQGQMDFFAQSPVFGGRGIPQLGHGENGFELSTFAHNSWAFYLMKFGLVGTIMIMLPPLLILLLTLFRRYAHPGLELHRRYLLATAPIYIFIDSMSGGLAYAPKTAFTGFLLCYCLSLLRNARAMPCCGIPPTRQPSGCAAPDPDASAAPCLMSCLSRRTCTAASEDAWPSSPTACPPTGSMPRCSCCAPATANTPSTIRRWSRRCR